MKQIRSSLLIFVALTLLWSCDREQPPKVASAPDSYYTCSMHPEVIESKPGPCPICGMAMIKVSKHPKTTGVLRLSREQQTLANIRFDTVALHDVATELSLEATVEIDQEKTSIIAARVAGRIEHLGVHAVGDVVHKGDFLYSIYSEDLNSAQAEYLSASQNDNSPMSTRLADAARKKLQRFDLSDAQINTLKAKGTVQDVMRFAAPTQGYVRSLLVSEGAYVNEGTSIVELADLSSLWLEAQVPVQFIANVHIGDEATYRIAGSVSSVQTARVIFIAPHVEAGEQFVRIRFEINHPDAQTHPGMPATIMLRKQQHRGLMLPQSAVLEDSHGASVWVLRPDGSFEIRMVQIGAEGSSGIEVTDGVRPGDVVVTSGAYLLGSEYQFKNGASPMEGMKM